ncbi:MAG TPA: M36 family metallopeptidase, partial [Gemmataceae bacterium]|nr:M36 family metallopeptidase [Gemmataceae bacterium]
APSAWLVYFPLAPGVARLAWATQIVGDPDGFLTLLDAEDGTLLFRKNLTSYQSQSASYTVYNDDSPAPMSPSTILPGSGTQAPVIARSTFTLIGNEAPNTFNNLGWMTDGTNSTDGNNVQAGIDRDGIDGVDAPVSGSPSRVFNSAYNPGPGNPPPGDDPLTANFQNGEVTDGFYWTNLFHDRLYLLGFTEAARNFQNDNFGRGGLAADRVSAEFQDSSGTDNANFFTPADGGRPRMQMFIFPGPAPDRSSGLDHDVLLHELTHGTSNRLHNNAAGLNSTMAGGMGEGWSDFYARALLSTAAEPVAGIYSTGGWVTNLIIPGYTDNYYYGIRRFPYAVRTTVGANGKPHNPLTFADIDSTQLNVTDGAFPMNPAPIFGGAFEVHNIGEVWAMALFEVRARFITRLGFSIGNQRILQFVTDGMKLDPVNPTLLQGRDAIIAAANAGGGTAADVADIWAGFAARGMGVLATVNNAAIGSVSENFNVPGDPIPTFSISDVSLSEGNAGTRTFAFNVSLANPSTGESRVTYATADGTATGATTMSAVGTITVNDNAAATPYPATLNVSGVGTLQGLRVRLNAVSHTFPADLDILLVGPGGQKVMLMSDAGGSGDLVAVDLTFADGAPLMTGGQIVTGTYGPTDLTPGDGLPAPAPATPYGTALSVFNGTNPNGVWSLYVADDALVDSGSLGGFTLIMATAADDYQAASGQLVFAPGTTTLPVNVTVNGDSLPEPNETFFVNLSAPINATIADGQGVGTILNDENFAPTISSISGKATPENVPLGVAFAVDDVESGPAGVGVTAA